MGELVYELGHSQFQIDLVHVISPFSLLKDVNYLE